MVGRLSALASFAVDVCPAAAPRKRRGGIEVVDPKPAVLRKGKHPIVPPAEATLLGVMLPEGVDQPKVADALERLPLAQREQRLSFPEDGIVNVARFGGDVEIAADDQRLLGLVAPIQVASQPLEPLQLELERRRIHRLPVGSVEADDPDSLNGGGDDSRLAVRGVIPHAPSHLRERSLRENRNPVVGLLARTNGEVSGRLQLEGGIFFLCAFELLQAENVWLRRSQPGQEPIQPGANGIDVPGGDVHGASPQARTTPNAVPQKHLSGRCVRATALKALFSRGASWHSARTWSPRKVPVGAA